MGQGRQLSHFGGGGHLGHDGHEGHPGQESHFGHGGQSSSANSSGTNVKVNPAEASGSGVGTGFFGGNVRVLRYRSATSAFFFASPRTAKKATSTNMFTLSRKRSSTQREGEKFSVRSFHGNYSFWKRKLFRLEPTPRVYNLHCYRY